MCVWGKVGMSRCLQSPGNSAGCPGAGLTGGGRPGFSERAVHVHNHRAISPDLESKLFKL